MDDRALTNRGARANPTPSSASTSQIHQTSQEGTANARGSARGGDQTARTEDHHPQPSAASATSWWWYSTWWNGKRNWNDAGNTTTPWNQEWTMPRRQQAPWLEYFVKRPFLGLPQGAGTYIEFSGRIGHLNAYGYTRREQTTRAASGKYILQTIPMQGWINKEERGNVVPLFGQTYLGEIADVDGEGKVQVQWAVGSTGSGTISGHWTWCSHGKKSSKLQK